MATPESPGARSGQRPRTRSGMSFVSHRSTGSDGKPKMDLTETAEEKARRRMTSKADPTKAMNEQQPLQAAFDKATLEPLRNLTHRDNNGNVITDPDRSNPTRPRLERPLDTIRSFEAAIDSSYGRRSSMRPGTSDAGLASRRSSYHQGYGYGSPQPRQQTWGSHPAVHGNYGHGGGRMSRPESYVDSYSTTPPPFRENRRPPPRNTSDPMLYGQNNNGMYANNNYNSYETATSGSGSGQSYGTDQWGNSTDPSSENSSVDRIAQPPPPPKPDMGEQYGFTGFGVGPDLQQSPIMEEEQYADYGHPAANGHYNQQSYGYNGHAGHNGYQTAYGGAGDMPPPPPPHAAKPTGVRPRAPSKLQSSRRTSSYDDYGTPERTDNGEKRKSWLKRRFSRNA